MRAARTCFDTLRRPPPVSHFTQGQRAGPATRSHRLTPVANPVDHNSAIHRKLIQMGLVEVVSVEPSTWRHTPLGKELDVELFQVFMGHWNEWEVPMILEEYGLLSESEFDAICESEADAESLLSGYVKRAYFEYRNASKYLH